MLIMRGQEDLLERATVSPIILASDKTQLMAFSSNKQAWPVYLMIGNIDKKIWWCLTVRATMLVAYLPVTKLKCFTDKLRPYVTYQLFHQCMESLLEPLKIVGEQGMEMTYANGWVCRVYTILAAYVTDFPEQYLVACCKESQCPWCLVPQNKQGLLIWSDPQDQRKTVEILRQRAEGLKPKAFVSQGLWPVSPFWANLSYTDIFQCFTPDIHHQLHKGIFKDHFVSWSTEAVDRGHNEVDCHFQSMTRHTTLWHFKKGISLVMQWIGNEYKNMEKIFLEVIVGAADEWVIWAVRAVMDFISYACFEIHTECSLERMDRAWSAIHENKKIFMELGICKNFIGFVTGNPQVGEFHTAPVTCDTAPTTVTDKHHTVHAQVSYGVMITCWGLKNCGLLWRTVGICEEPWGSEAARWLRWDSCTNRMISHQYITLLRDSQRQM